MSSLLASMFMALLRSSLVGKEPAWLSEIPDQLAIALIIAGLACALALLGLLVAIPQSLVLQLLDIRTRRWIVATSLGFLAGDLVLGVLLTGLFLPPVPERMNSTFWFLERFLPLLGIGLGVGASQWILLRHKIRWPFLWIPAHAIALPAGYIAALILPSRLIRALTSGDTQDFLRIDSSYHASLFSRLFPLFLAGIVATFLTAWLLQDSRPRREPNGAA